MTAVSMNRAEMSLKGVSGDTIRSCLATQNDTSHFEVNRSVIMPLRNMANLTGHRGIGGGSAGHTVLDTTVTGGTATTATATSAGAGVTTEHTPFTNRQPISATSHSYSSDSDIVTNTTATPSATAMRRLYFKSAKLNKTTSITTVHQQQQAQHVPKVNAQPNNKCRDKKIKWR